MTNPSYEQRIAAELLDTRTRSLATRKAGSEQDEAGRRVVAFMLGGDLYGILIEETSQVVPLGGVTPIPDVEAAVLGIIGLQGHIHTVLDLRHVLNLTASETDETGHLIILRRPRPRLAIQCSRAVGIVDIVPLPETEAAPHTSNPIGSYGRVRPEFWEAPNATLAVIDVDRLLAAFRQNQQELSL